MNKHSTCHATDVCLCNPIKQVVHLFVLVCVIRDIAISKAEVGVGGSICSSTCEGFGEELLKDISDVGSRNYLPPMNLQKLHF